MADVTTYPTDAPAPAAVTLRGAAIASLGAAVPARVVTNEEIGERLGVDDAWIMKRFGVRTRHYAAPDERLADLAAAAGRQALERAGVAAEDLDMVLVGTFTSDEMMPHTSPHVAAALGAHRAGAIDVGAACASWVSALVMGAGMIEAGRSETMLVVGCDLLSRRLDHEDKKTAPLMADGAGAVVLRATDGPARVGPSVFHHDAEFWRSTYMARDDQVLRMEGPETYQVAVDAMTSTTTELLEREGLTIDDIDLFVYHQGNARILNAVGLRLGLKAERVAHYIEEFGNASAATVPLALEACKRDGRLRPGMKVFLASIGGGYSWGACVVTWGDA
ncbi:MAG: ketoacyl-ACP synthase III [Solirubrobacterales bacterium]|nr:ketoacyl-ACP synthase III [Solirubrobacterales bacterium]